jgi:hydrogenase maturation protease HycI
MMDRQTAAFFSALRDLPPGDILLVGMGNTLKADDGIGSAIGSQLKKIAPQNVIDAGTVPENYIQVIIKKAPGVILFIDAIDFAAPAGTVKIFDPGELSAGGLSTHTLSPRLLIDIIKQDVSATIYFIGIQPKSTRLTEPMSPEVALAKKELITLFEELLPSQ